MAPQGMILWALVPASMCCGAAQGAAPEPQPPAAASQQHVEGETFDVEYERFSRLTVPVLIDGKGPYRFLIDTGAQATVLARDLADELGLVERRSAMLIGAASSVRVETVYLDNFSLGSSSFSLPGAPIVEGEHIGGADGILGVDTLQHQRILFDFDVPRLAVIESVEARRGDFEIVVRARRKLGQLVISQAVIDGVQTSVIIDTGAQGSIGNPILQRRLRRADPLGMTSMTDVNGQILPVEMRVGGLLQMEDVSIRNVPIAFADSPTFHALGLSGRPALILGMNALRLFRRVVIDFPNGRIMLDLPAPPA